MQHSAKQATKQSVTQAILGVLGGVLPGNTAGNLARLGIQIGAGAMFMKYSRADEAQADAVGAIIMYKAGYNPKAMAEFFQKLEQQGGGNGPQFLSDHPNPGNRVASVEKEIQDWPPKSYLSTSQAFVRAKQEATRVKAYTAQQIADGAKQGVWARQNAQGGAVPANVPASSGGNAGAPSGPMNVSYEQVRPSNNFKQLQQNAFSIAYPDNWQASGDQNSGAVTIAPQAGVTQGAIAYGVIVAGGQDPNASSLDQATQDLIQNMQQQNPGLRVSGNMQSIQVNGLQGRSVILRGNSPVQRNGQPLPERDWVITLPYQSGGGLLYLVFIAPENDFDRLRPTYEKMLNSLQVR